MSLHIRSRWWHPMIKSIASTRVGTWLNRYALPPLDRMMMRLSGGRTNATGLVAGLPVIMLTTTGAKSGKQRTTPLIALPDGRKLALIATNWGQKRNPAWYHNLRANPQASVTVGGETKFYVAREATPKEYDKYWRWAVRVYPGYENYKEWCGDREIPILVLSPAEPSSTEA
jgi:deazaflavin-dependent oxidoreductase (nitroreductase family)